MAGRATRLSRRLATYCSIRLQAFSYFFPSRSICALDSVFMLPLYVRLNGSTSGKRKNPNAGCRHRWVPDSILVADEYDEVAVRIQASQIVDHPVVLLRRALHLDRDGIAGLPRDDDVDALLVAES